MRWNILSKNKSNAYKTIGINLALVFMIFAKPIGTEGAQKPSATKPPPASKKSTGTTAPSATPVQAPDSVDCSNACNMLQPFCATKAFSPEETEAIKKACMAKVQPNDCKESSDKFEKSLAEFKKACVDGGPYLNTLGKILNLDKSSIGGIDSCRVNATICADCSGGNGQFTIGNRETKLDCPQPKDSSSDSEDSENVNASSNVSSTLAGTQAALEAAMGKNISSTPLKAGSVSKDTKALMKDYENELLTCLPRNAEELKTMKDSLATPKKEAHELETTLLKAQKELSEIGQALTDKQNELNDNYETLNSEAQKAMEKLKAQLEEGLQKATQDITTSISNMETDIRRIEQSKRSAQIAYAEGLANLDRQCHAAALARVEALRKQMTEQMKTSTYTSGNFSKLMQSVGTSSRQKFQVKADEFFQDCRKDKAYRSSVESTERARKNTIDTANEEIAALRKKQDQARSELLQLRTTQSQKVLTQINQISQDASRKSALIQKELLTAQMKSQAKTSAAQAEIAVIQRKLGEEKAEINDTQTKLRLIRKSSGSNASTAPKEGSVDNAVSSLKEAERMAKEVINTCCSTGNDGRCKSACEFMGTNTEGCKPSAAPASGPRSSTGAPGSR